MKFLILLYRSLWFVLLPLLKLLAKQRVEFENKNLSDLLSRPFGQNDPAEMAFEVSSEGELEQALPLMKHLLAADKQVELIFCSPSVEHKCQKLGRRYPQKLRILRLPLITCHPWTKHRYAVSNWLTAKTLVLCRYDFFPELLYYGQDPQKKLMLIYASLKGKRWQWPGNQLVYRWLYGQFQQIITANPKETDNLKYLGRGEQIVGEHDFRINQILERQATASETLLKHKIMKTYLDYLEQFKPMQRLVLGSYWAGEQALFNQQLIDSIKMGEIHVTIAPHDLSAKGLLNIVHGLEEKSIPVFMLNERINALELSAALKSPQVIICTIKGILCELYTYFEIAWVGGGHGRSIHSVLEPCLAGAKVICGPKTHRSTEFDWVSEHFPAEIVTVSKLDNFHANFKQLIQKKRQSRDFLQGYNQKLIEYTQGFLSK